MPAPAEHVDVLAELLGEDLESWPSDAWLVLDDYQEIAPTADAEKFVEELVAASPIQLLVASRQRPSWITARRILYGEMLELNQTELAMDGHEAAEVLTERNAASASGLVALANGWPAVIGLASVSGAEIEDGESVPESLYQFFAEEVFTALDPDVQEGLATLAIAPVIDRTLAVRLLGEEADRVCSAALDVGILVERGARLEIHPLARAFLEGRREQTALGPDSERAERCLSHYRERRDWDAAFDLIARRDLLSQLEPLLEEALDELLDAARLSTIASWCDCADGANLEKAIFSMSRAELALRRGRLAAAQAHAESVASQRPDLEFRALSIAGRAAHLESREEEALEFYRRAAACAPTDSLRREALWGRVACMTDLELPDTIKVVEELASGLGVHGAREAVRAAGHRLASRARFGVMDLSDADRAFELIPAVDDALVESGFLSVYCTHLAAGARYEDARHVATLLLTTARRYRLEFAVPYAVYAAGIAEAGLRNYEEAERRLNDGIRDARAASHAHGEQNCVAAQIRTLGQQGRYESALTLAHDHSLRPSLRVPLQMRSELIGSYALVLAAAGKLDEAVRAIDAIRGLSRSMEGIVLAAAVRATVSVKRHDRDAIDTANRLCEAAISTGALDFLVTAYRSSPELLAIMLRGDASASVLRGLIRRVGDEDLATAVGRPLRDERNAKTCLTAREYEVYELLRQSLTNREIAQLLFITEGTAKVHVQHIFEKLGIRSRKVIAMQAALERAAQATSAIDTGAGADS